MRLKVKVMLCGLSNAGKTSIKKIVFKEGRISSISTFSTIIDYERLLARRRGISFLLVDFGGKKDVIEDFLEKYASFVFDNVDIFIYVFDVSRSDRINEEIDFFRMTFQRLQENCPRAYGMIFFHKADMLDKFDRLEREEIISKLKTRFVSSSSIPLSFYVTSIYDPASLEWAFNEVLIKFPDLLSESDSLHEELSFFAITSAKVISPSQLARLDSVAVDAGVKMDSSEETLDFLSSETSNREKANVSLIALQVKDKDDAQRTKSREMEENGVVFSRKKENISKNVAADLKEITNRLRMILNLYRTRVKSDKADKYRGG